MLIFRIFLNQQVTKCVPELENLNDLEARLVETNDYAGFITHVRSLFLKSLES